MTTSSAITSTLSQYTNTSHSCSPNSLNEVDVVGAATTSSLRSAQSKPTLSLLSDPTKSFSSSTRSFRTLWTQGTQISSPHIARYDTRSITFNSCMGFVVLLNTVNLSVQVSVQSPFDTGAQAKIILEITQWLEYCFVGIFTVELLMRFYYEKCCHALLDPWNFFDAVLLVLSYVDGVSLLLRHHHNDSGLVSEMANFNYISTLRMLRLLRLVRLARLFKDLQLLLVGMFKSLRRSLWVLVLLAGCIWCGAIFFTEGIGNSECCFWDDMYLKEERFGGIMRSSFTLFQIVALDAWCSAVAWPVIQEKPHYAIMFVLFVAGISFGIVNMLVAVVVESVQEAANGMQVNHYVKVKEERRQSADAKRQLTKIFKAADVDNSGVLGPEEFKLMLQDPRVQNRIARVMTSFNSTPLTQQELSGLWNTHDQGVQLKDFVGGVLCCCQFRSVDSIAQSFQVRRIEHLLADLAGSLDAQDRKINRLDARIENSGNQKPDDDLDLLSPRSSLLSVTSI